MIQDSSLGGNEFAVLPFGTIYGVLASFLLGAVLLLAFPGTTRSVAHTVRDEPLRSGGFGLLTLVAVPLVLVAFAITIIGIPVTIMGAILFAFVAWAALVYGWYAAATVALARMDVTNDWLALGGGLLASAVIGLVPILGGLATLVAFLLGLGAIALVLDEYRRTRGDRDEPETGPTEGTDRTGGDAQTA